MLVRSSDPDFPLTPIRTPSGWRLGDCPDLRTGFETLPWSSSSSIVPVIMRFPDNTIEWSGTAFFVYPGLLVTAAHVAVDPNVMAEVERPSESELNEHALVRLDCGYELLVGLTAGPTERKFVTVRALMAGQHTETALLQIMDLADCPTWEFGAIAYYNMTADAPQPGQECVAIGYPVMSHTDIALTAKTKIEAAVGEIEEVFPCGLGDSYRPQPHFTFQNNFPSGMSGGPVFNEVGDVIGVASRSLEPDSLVTPLGIASLLQPLWSLPIADPRKPGSECSLADLITAGDLPLAGTGDVTLDYRSSRNIVSWKPKRPRQGRNDQCACGSGRKYKYCCCD